MPTPMPIMAATDSAQSGVSTTAASAPISAAGRRGGGGRRSRRDERGVARVDPPGLRKQELSKQPLLAEPWQTTVDVSTHPSTISAARHEAAPTAIRRAEARDVAAREMTSPNGLEMRPG